MQQYKNLIKTILDEGCYKSDRTGTGTLSLFGPRLAFDLQEGFPLVTIKETNFKAVAHELLWFLSGDSNIKYLNDNGVHIWDQWADEDGYIGPMYGHQWRHWEDIRNGKEIDQLSDLIEGLKTKPDSRRHKVSAWNVSDLPDESISPQRNVLLGRMALAPCHGDFQCYVRYQDGEKYLDMKVEQRSADVFLGLPFNIASYALLTHMIAHQCGFAPGGLIWNGGDTHIYVNHINQARQALDRQPRDFLPELAFSRKPNSIFDYKFEDIVLLRYEPHKAIKAPVAV